MGKLAIIQCADTGPLESLVVMLRAVGYDCCLPGRAVKDELRGLGHRLVLDVEGLVKGMGYERPFPLPEAGLAEMSLPDVVYVDVKAHQCYEAVVNRWPGLKNRVLWYRIQGGRPEHVIKPDGEDCGDEVNPPCPVLTPNMWYRDEGTALPGCLIENGRWRLQERGGAYACHPPFYRFDEYYPHNGRATAYETPVCLVHRADQWGYGALIPQMRRLGVRVFGLGSPDGLLDHCQVPDLLAHALAMVHLKSSDAPGYALYEALAAACPVVCTRRLIWRCKMSDLLIPGETCLVFDRETHDALTPADVEDCTREVAAHLGRLSDPVENRRLGQAGRERLRAVTWSDRKPEDVESLRAFMARWFP